MNDSNTLLEMIIDALNGGLGVDDIARLNKIKTRVNKYYNSPRFGGPDEIVLQVLEENPELDLSEWSILIDDREHAHNSYCNFIKKTIILCTNYFTAQDFKFAFLHEIGHVLQFQTKKMLHDDSNENIYQNDVIWNGITYKYDDIKKIMSDVDDYTASLPVAKNEEEYLLNVKNESTLSIKGSPMGVYYDLPWEADANLFALRRIDGTTLISFNSIYNYFKDQI